MEALQSISVHIQRSNDPLPDESFKLTAKVEEGKANLIYRLRYECQPDESSLGFARGEVSLSPHQADTLLAQCQRIKLGLVPDFAMGLDGTTTKITIVQGWNKLVIEWWPEAPKQWKPVERLIKMLREVAREASGRSED